MVTAPKGDHPGVPLNAEGNRVSNTWDAAKDEAAGEQCRAYGAAGVMRLPGRIHVTWESDNTLKVDTEAGTQQRLFVFGQPAAASAPTWQGASVASWEFAGRGRGRGAPAPQYGDLKVVTTHMKPGYLQKNGVPYSENAVLTEYFARANEPKRRLPAHPHAHRRRPAVPQRAIHAQYALQEASRQRGVPVVAAALLRAVTPQRYRSMLAISRGLCRSMGLEFH